MSRDQQSIEPSSQDVNTTEALDNDHCHHRVPIIIIIAIIIISIIIIIIIIIITWTRTSSHR